MKTTFRPRLSIGTLAAAAAAAALAATTLAFASERTADEPKADAAARLTVPQATTIAEVLGNGRATEVEYKARQRVYEVKLAQADGTSREVYVAAYGGRLLETEPR